jgi:translocation and assembly module TamA
MRFIVFLLLLFLPILTKGSPPLLQVEVVGINEQDKQHILSNLSMKNAENEKNLTQERVLALNQLAIEEITTALQTLGFYQPIITPKLFRNECGWRVEYYIQAGPLTRIHAIKLKLSGSGQDNPELCAMAQYSPFKKQDPLNHSLYETFKQHWLGKALQLGFLDAEYTISEIRLSTRQNYADIVLEMDTGKRYHFGEVYFASPPYPVEYLNRYIPFTSGTPYTTEQLLTFQKNLTESELFKRVRIDPDMNETEDYAIPLKVRLTPRPANQYTASIGFGTNTGPRGFLGYERRIKTFPGHRFNMNIKGSRRLNQGNIQYAIPGKCPTTDRLVFGYQVTEERLCDKKYSLLEEIGVTQIQKREDQLEQILALQYQREKFRILQGDPKQKTHFLLPSVGYVWSNINNKELLPTGTYVSFVARGGLGLFLSTTNLMQAETRIKWAIPMGEITRLILRTDLGATAISNTQDLPLTLRFFTGGDHTVRGYGYQSLGPKGVDQFGNVIVVGGRYLFVGSTEIERKIYKDISGAVFFDCGNAVNRFGPRLAQSAGVGVRWRTPLGPLRLDIAQALMQKKRKPRVHLTFGLDL